MAESRHSVAVTLHRMKVKLLVYERLLCYIPKSAQIRPRPIRTSKYSQKGHPASRLL